MDGHMDRKDIKETKRPADELKTHEKFQNNMLHMQKNTQDTECVKFEYLHFICL